MFKYSLKDGPVRAKSWSATLTGKETLPGETFKNFDFWEKMLDKKKEKYIFHLT